MLNLFQNAIESLPRFRLTISAVPLRVVPDPLVPDPLLAQQHRASRVSGELVRVVVRVQVVPPNRRPLLREHGDARVGPHRRAAGLRRLQHGQDGRHPVAGVTRAVVMRLAVMVEVRVDEVEAADAVVAAHETLRVTFTRIGVKAGQVLDPAVQLLKALVFALIGPTTKL